MLFIFSLSTYSIHNSNNNASLEKLNLTKFRFGQHSQLYHNKKYTKLRKSHTNLTVVNRTYDRPTVKLSTINVSVFQRGKVLLKMRNARDLMMFHQFVDTGKKERFGHSTKLFSINK